MYFLFCVLYFSPQPKINSPQSFSNQMAGFTARFVCFLSNYISQLCHLELKSLKRDTQSSQTKSLKLLATVAAKEKGWQGEGASQGRAGRGGADKGGTLIVLSFTTTLTSYLTLKPSDSTALVSP